jgi:hypothetical protein
LLSFKGLRDGTGTNVLWYFLPFHDVAV